MLSRLLNALFTPKYPRGYTGRHRAGFAFARAAGAALPAVSLVAVEAAT
jgi:hypothetical protein